VNSDVGMDAYFSLVNLVITPEPFWFPGDKAIRGQ
jgi:hypothetical protein